MYFSSNTFNILVCASAINGFRFSKQTIHALNHIHTFLQVIISTSHNTVLHPLHKLLCRIIAQTEAVKRLFHFSSSHTPTQTHYHMKRLLNAITGRWSINIALKPSSHSHLKITNVSFFPNLAESSLLRDNSWRHLFYDRGGDSKLEARNGYSLESLLTAGCGPDKNSHLLRTCLCLCQRQAKIIPSEVVIICRKGGLNMFPEILSPGS